MSAPWAPKAIRPAFDAANMGSRCFNNCAPRLAIIDGNGWICGCPLLRCAADCRRDRHVSVAYRLGPMSALPAAASRLTRTALPGASAAMAAARPFPGTALAWEYIDPRDATTAQGLGVDSWRWFTVGTTPALLGMREGEPVAVIALLAKHRANFDRLMGAS